MGCYVLRKKYFYLLMHPYMSSPFHGHELKSPQLCFIRPFLVCWIQISLGHTHDHLRRLRVKLVLRRGPSVTRSALTVSETHIVGWASYFKHKQSSQDSPHHPTTHCCGSYRLVTFSQSPTLLPSNFRYLPTYSHFGLLLYIITLKFLSTSLSQFTFIDK